MRRTVLRVLSAVSLSMGVSLAGVAVGVAAPVDDPRPSTGTGTPSTCRSAGLPGQIIEVTATVTDTAVDITAVPADHQLTGVVVQGIRTYHKYPYLGGLPWNGLRAPLGTPVTRWFACAKPRPSATTAPGTTTPTATTTETPMATTTTTTSRTSAPETTTAVFTSGATTTPVAPASGGLAGTGFDGGALVLFGAGLLVAGAAASILSRVRRRRG